MVSNPAYSGLRERRYERPDEEIALIDVEVRRLDDLVDADQMIRLIKIDVEGAELGVLAGGAKTLGRCLPYVIFEHGLGAADFYDTRPSDVHELLTAEVGLHVYVMSDWLAGRPSLTRPEFVEQFEKRINYYFMACPLQ